MSCRLARLCERWRWPCLVPRPPEGLVTEAQAVLLSSGESRASGAKPAGRTDCRRDSEPSGSICVHVFKEQLVKGQAGGVRRAIEVRTGSVQQGRERPGASGTAIRRLSVLAAALRG